MLRSKYLLANKGYARHECESDFRSLNISIQSFSASNTLIYQDIAISDHFVPGLFRSQTISFMNYVRSWMIWPWKMSFNGVSLRKIMSRDILVTGKISVPVISIM